VSGADINAGGVNDGRLDVAAVRLSPPSPLFPAAADAAATTADATAVAGSASTLGSSNVVVRVEWLIK
jgi:hypothetical protein